MRYGEVIEVKFHSVGWIEYSSSLDELAKEIDAKQALIKKLEIDVEFMLNVHAKREYNREVIKGRRDSTTS